MQKKIAVRSGLSLLCNIATIQLKIINHTPFRVQYLVTGKMAVGLSEPFLLNSKDITGNWG